MSDTITSAAVYPNESTKHFPCSIPGCKGYFDSRKLLDQHIVRVHNKKFFCPRSGCDRGTPGNGFGTTLHLKSHIASIHDKKRDIVCDYPGCRRGTSGNGFNRISNLTAHKRRHEPRVRKRSQKRPQKRSQKSRLSSSVAFLCPIPSCPRGAHGNGFESSSVLNRHINCHNNNGDIVCDYPGCIRGIPGQGFNQISNLLCHKRKHETGEFDREPPRKREQKSRLLSSITRNKDGEASTAFPCPIPGCPRGFGESSCLKRHINCHNNKGDIVCDYPGCIRGVAGEGFNEISNLKVHKRLHETGEFDRNPPRKRLKSKLSSSVTGREGASSQPIGMTSTEGVKKQGNPELSSPHMYVGEPGTDSGCSVQTAAEDSQADLLGSPQASSTPDYCNGYPHPTVQATFLAASSKLRQEMHSTTESLQQAQNGIHEPDVSLGTIDQEDSGYGLLQFDLLVADNSDAPALSTVCLDTQAVHPQAQHSLEVQGDGTRLAPTYVEHNGEAEEYGMISTLEATQRFRSAADGAPLNSTIVSEYGSLENPFGISDQTARFGTQFSYSGWMEDLYIMHPNQPGFPTQTSFSTAFPPSVQNPNLPSLQSPPLAASAAELGYNWSLPLGNVLMGGSWTDSTASRLGGGQF